MCLVLSLSDVTVYRCDRIPAGLREELYASLGGANGEEPDVGFVRPSTISKSGQSGAVHPTRYGSRLAASLRRRAAYNFSVNVLSAKNPDAMIGLQRQTSEHRQPIALCRRRPSSRRHGARTACTHRQRTGSPAQRRHRPTDLGRGNSPARLQRTPEAILRAFVPLADRPSTSPDNLAAALQLPRIWSTPIALGNATDARPFKETMKATLRRDASHVCRLGVTRAPAGRTPQREGGRRSKEHWGPIYDAPKQLDEQDRQRRRSHGRIGICPTSAADAYAHG